MNFKNAAVAGTLILSVVSPAVAKPAAQTPIEEVQKYLKAKGIETGLLIHEYNVVIPMRDGIRLTTDSISFAARDRLPRSIVCAEHRV